MRKLWFFIVPSVLFSFAFESIAYEFKKTISYKDATEMACKIRNGNNEKYCGCISDVMNEVTPENMKDNLSILNMDSIRAISNVIVEHEDVLSKCNKYKKYDLEIPLIPLSKTASMTIENNGDNVLYPDDVTDLKPFNRKLNYEYSVSSIKKMEDILLRLSRIEDEKFYFDYINKTSKTITKEYILWSEGIEYFRNKSEYELVDGFNNCKFKLGKCSYSVDGKFLVANVVFRNGIWYYNTAGIWGDGGDTRFINSKIYDKRGFTLYSSFSMIGGRQNVKEETPIETFNSTDISGFNLNKLN